MNNTLKDMGFEIETTGAPKAHNADEWNAVAFTTCIKYNSRVLWIGEYKMGIGNFGSDCRTVNQACNAAILKNIKPSLSDVLYSLVSDSDAINHASFEDWADEFGYSSDSIKARNVYDECMKIALAFRNICGESVMAELQELFQDY